jgi:hypothetical protein
LPLFSFRPHPAVVNNALPAPRPPGSCVITHQKLPNSRVLARPGSSRPRQRVFEKREAGKQGLDNRAVAGEMGTAGGRRRARTLLLGLLLVASGLTACVSGESPIDAQGARAARTRGAVADDDDDGDLSAVGTPRRPSLLPRRCWACAAVQVNVVRRRRGGGAGGGFIRHAPTWPLGRVPLLATHNTQLHHMLC